MSEILKLAQEGDADAKAVISGDENHLFFQFGERLLITRVKGKTVAMLYRAVVPGTTEPVPFSSPWRTPVSTRTPVSAAGKCSPCNTPVAGRKPRSGFSA